MIKKIYSNWCERPKMIRDFLKVQWLIKLQDMYIMALNHVKIINLITLN